MSPIRVGFDIDGVVADFAQAYREVEQRLFDDKPGRPDEPEREEREQEHREAQAAREASESGIEPTEGSPPRELRRRRDLIWREIQRTPDFWLSLRPLEDGGVRRIHEQMMRHGWEVFFITQRPATAGDTVQRQTQRWLVEQGFDLPSVLVIGGSRGAAAAALRLSYHVDDSPQNCLDVMSSAGARAVLITSDTDQMVTTARKLEIAIMPSIQPCLDLLDQVSAARSNPTLLKRLATLVGWR